MDTPITRIAGAILALGFCFYMRARWMPLAASASSGKSAAEQLAVVQKLTAAGRYDAARDPARQLYGAHPENHVYIESLATIEGHLSHFAEEAELWERYLQFSPVPIEGCPQIGIAYRRQNQNDRAIDALKRCLAIESNNPDVLYYLASTYQLAGETTLAAETYRQGLSFAPNDPDLILGMARLDFRAGRTAEAAEAARRVLDRLPENTDALLLAGEAAMRSGANGEARQYLEKGAALSSRYTDIHLALGRLAESESKREEALIHYREALRLDPANTTARERIATLAENRP